MITDHTKYHIVSKTGMERRWQVYLQGIRKDSDSVLVSFSGANFERLLQNSSKRKTKALMKNIKMEKTSHCAQSCCLDSNSELDFGWFEDKILIKASGKNVLLVYLFFSKAIVKVEFFEGGFLC